MTPTDKIKVVFECKCVKCGSSLYSEVFKCEVKFQVHDGFLCIECMRKIPVW